MLVLTRKPDQRILIGDNIAIMIVAIRGNRVRIGIEAPKDIAVVREELVGKVSPFDDCTVLDNLLPAVHSNGDEPLEH